MVELEDTLDLGSNIRKDVRVRVSLGGFKKIKGGINVKKTYQKI